MYIKYFDEKGRLAINYYLSQMHINIRESPGNPEKFNVMMSDVALASDIDLQKSEDIVNKIFETLCENKELLDITNDSFKSFDLVISDVDLEDGVDLQESQDTINKIFETLCEGKDLLDITK